MFYLFEFYFRIIYLVFSVLLCFLFLYSTIDKIILLLTYRQVFLTSTLSIIYLPAFITSSPESFFNLQLYLCLNFSIYLIQPFLFSFIFSFSSAGLKKQEKLLILNSFFFYFSINFFFLILFTYYVFPFLWVFLESLNEFNTKEALITIDYEPNINAYFKVLFSSLICINAINIILFFFFTFLQRSFYLKLYLTFHKNLILLLLLILFFFKQNILNIIITLTFLTFSSFLIRIIFIFKHEIKKALLF
jgi:hypothetical protein